jgi:transcriptional regulator with XRE-family HTH domain
MNHEQLIATRKLKKMSQEKLADSLGMEQTTYSKKERGKSPLSDNEWEKIASILNVDVEDIRPKDQVVNPGHIHNPSISDHGVCIGVQYVNMPKEVLDTILAYNKFLENELKRFKDF